MKKLLLLFIPLMFFFSCEEEENNNDNTTSGENNSELLNEDFEIAIKYHITMLSESDGELFLIPGGDMTWWFGPDCPDPHIPKQISAGYDHNWELYQTITIEPNANLSTVFNYDPSDLGCAQINVKIYVDYDEDLSEETMELKDDRYFEFGCLELNTNNSEDCYEWIDVESSLNESECIAFCSDIGNDNYVESSPCSGLFNFNYSINLN